MPKHRETVCVFFRPFRCLKSRFPVRRDSNRIQITAIKITQSKIVRFTSHDPQMFESHWCLCCSYMLPVFQDKGAYATQFKSQRLSCDSRFESRYPRHLCSAIPSYTPLFFQLLLNQAFAMSILLPKERPHGSGIAWDLKATLFGGAEVAFA